MDIVELSDIKCCGYKYQNKQEDTGVDIPKDDNNTDVEVVMKLFQSRVIVLNLKNPRKLKKMMYWNSN